MKDLISLHDLTAEEVKELLELGIKLKKEQKSGKEHHILKGKTLGMIFTKSSTRTRVSFEVGMTQLGGYPLFLSSNDIQLGRGETIYDTAKVLERMLDGIMIRTYAHQDVLDLAKYADIPVINALTDLLHPCQVLADLMTAYEHKGKLEGLKLAYIGDGNNMAHSLMYGCAKAGLDCAVATPEDYQCGAEVVANAKDDFKKSGRELILTCDPKEAIKGADVVYTDTWVSMGQEAEKAERQRIFTPYQVNGELFAYADSEAIFMHCLPAYRGFEVTEEVIDGAHSIIFDEAENRLHAQKAVMATLMG
ncbi:MAG: ornithine carbamoyltransferase [Oscillospiraceae bacterium]|nr:ornithine carbamoyltransferase [Oscillospiraceae bacterium]